MVMTTLPLSDLKLDERANVRVIGRGTDPSLVASILHHGVIVPLVVRPNGTDCHLVIDGGKRLAALQVLVESGAFHADHPVPVIIEKASEAEARETSLTLNTVRSAMHPVDQYRAFAALHRPGVAGKTSTALAGEVGEGLDADMIAKRFGIERKLVEQRLALGALDDQILDAWVKGDIGDDVAEAFTLIPDKKTQRSVYSQLCKEGRVWAATVKAHVKAGADNCGPMLTLIGLDTYEAAGGKVTRDLFGTDHIVSDPALLKSLVDQKIGETVEQLKAEGWGWVMTERPEHLWKWGHVQAKFTPTPAEKKKLEALDKKARNEDLDDDECDQAREEYDALRQDILVRGISAEDRAGAGCFVTLNRRGELEIERGRLKPEDKPDAKKKAAAKGKAEDKKPVAALTKAATERLTQARQLAIKQALVQHPHKDPLAKLLAQTVAECIDPGRWNYAPQAVQSRFEKIAATINEKVLTSSLCDTFDREDYFKGASRPLVLAVLKETVGADQAKAVASKPKGELVKLALARVPKTWLPKELRPKAK